MAQTRPIDLRVSPQSDVLVIGADGSGRRNLTRHHAHERSPAVAPHGRTIAYVRDRAETWLMNADGANQRRLLRGDDLGLPIDPTLSAGRPRWAPDSRRLAIDGWSNAVCRPRPIGCELKAGVVVAGTARPDRQRFEGAYPSWSTTGRHLAVWTNSGSAPGPRSVAIRSLIDGVVRTIFQGDSVAAFWAPRGNALAVTERSGDDGPRVSVIDSSGRVLKPIAGASSPEWAPDGRRLAFTRGVDRESEIWVARIRSSRLTRLTRNAFADSAPSWSPDGRRLAFISRRSAFWGNQVYVMNSDGKRVRRVTGEAGPCGLDDRYQPLVWTRDSRRIIYAAGDYQGRPDAARDPRCSAP